MVLDPESLLDPFGLGVICLRSSSQDGSETSGIRGAAGAVFLRASPKPQPFPAKLLAASKPPLKHGAQLPPQAESRPL